MTSLSGVYTINRSTLDEAKLHLPEKHFPLRVMVCTECWLVQTQDFAEAAELFTHDYAYFSSFSTSWLRHAKDYVTAMINRFKLDRTTLIVEIAANDGYLLCYFRENGIPCFGVEPTQSTAAAARTKGIEIIEDFFGAQLSEKLVSHGIQADLIVANNVLAHVPDINDFVTGFAKLLKKEGVATFEFPHLLRLVDENQFDTIYHEHFSYLSLTAVTRIFDRNGMTVFDVEELPTHGGSLRVFAKRKDSSLHPVTQDVMLMLMREYDIGVTKPSYYGAIQASAETIKDDLLVFLLTVKSEKKKVIAYGAAAKGNTLFNFTGIRSDLIPYVVDQNPAKQGKYMPGSRIPIVNEQRIREEKPDYILILPWNLRDEVITQLDYVYEWGTRFVTAVPTLSIT